MSVADPPDLVDHTDQARLDRLIDRLLAAGEAAIATGEWERASETALDVLAVDPTNDRAQQIVDRTRREQPATGQRALMTLLFSDLVGSTPLADNVEPETVRDVYHAYRDLAHHAVERFGGHIIQFQGDAVVACFGHPDAHEDDARRAVLAALALVSSAPGAGGGELDIQLRVAVHTGMVVVADFGLGSIGERGTIVGSAPNLAARLQALATPGRVVVSDVTHHIIESDFDSRSIGVHQLKGIKRPVEVFEVGTPRHPASRLDAPRFHRTTLVGRDGVRSQLLDAWAATVGGAAGRPAGYLVRGDAGIGKSRLVADIRQCVEQEAGGILETSCSSYHSRVAFWPVAHMIERDLGLPLGGDRAARLDALRTGLERRGLDDAAVAVLAALVGVTDDDLPLPEVSAPALRQQQIDLLLEWLRRLGEARPRLLLVEDLQWADASTSELLGRIAGAAVGGVLMVLTSRSEPAHEWRAGLRDLPLTPLGDREAFALVEALSGGALSAAQCATIVARGEGMPLFLEELTGAALAAADGALPVRLNELFTGRLKAPGVDLRLAQMAATIGASFDADLLTRLADPDTDVATGLRRMQKVGLIEPATDDSPSGLRFRHVLFRDAAYETQVLDTRRANHGRIAAAMLAAPSATTAPAALIADHLDRAGMVGDAVGQYFVAADVANRAGANAEALELLGRALDLCRSLPGGFERDLNELGLRLLRVLCASSLKGYGAQEVADDTTAIEALCRSMPASPATVTALIVVWSFAFTRGELRRAAGMVESLQGLVSQPELAALQPEVDSVAGYQAFYHGELASARRLLERAVAHQGDASPSWPLPNDPLVAAFVALACISTLEGDSVQAERWERSATERAESLPFPRGAWSLGFTRVYGAWMRTTAGDPLGAARLAAATVDVGATHGFPYFVGLGGVYADPSLPGAPADIASATEHAALLETMGHRSMRPMLQANLARVHGHHGQLDEGRTKAEEAMVSIEESGEWLSLPWVLLARAELAVAAGDVVPAAALMVDAQDAASRQGSHLLAVRAAVALAGLADPVRPPDWRERLQTARRGVPAGSSFADVRRADELLAGR